MTERRNALAVAIMAGTLITSELKGRAERAELVEIMTADDVEQVPVRDADGVDLGKASLCAATARAKVVDEAALLAWVKARRPDQIREIVEPAYVKSLLKQFDAEGAAADEVTGEVIPGIEAVEGSPYVKVTPNGAARERMSELIHESGLLQLTTARRVVDPEPEPAPMAKTFVIEGLDDEEPAPW